MLTVPPWPLELESNSTASKTTTHPRRMYHHITTCTLILTGNSIPDHDYNGLEQESQLAVVLKKVYKESLLWVYIESGQQILVQLSKKLHTLM